MKSSKILNNSFVVLIFLLSMISSTYILGYYNGSEGGSEPSDDVDDPVLVNIINDINILKEKILESSDSSWKKPAQIRKSVMIIKLNVLEKQIVKNHLDCAYDKLFSDIKPKLTYSWVINEELQTEFGIACNNILDKIEGAMTPDVDPPVIILTADQTISDENAIGGVLIEWEISDLSGIAEATVTLNGDVIASYTCSGSISDSYLLANTPGDNLVEIIAIDNVGLVSTTQSFISITDDDTTAPTISIEYCGSGTEFDPGWWNIDIEDLESGLEEVLILINGYLIIYDTFGGYQSSYQVEVPGSVGTHTVEVIVTNNDNEWLGDQESASATDTITIVVDPFPPPF